MEDDELLDGLEELYKELGAKTKALDNSENESILFQIEEVENKLDKKIKPSTNGRGPDADSILPHGELPGKKVLTMKIKKRRLDIEPMGF